MLSFSAKSLFILTISSLFMFSGLKAQDSLAITETVRTMSRGSQPCFTIHIPQAKLRDASSGWKKYVRQSGAKNIKGDNSEWVASDAVISSIGNDSISVYAQLQQDNDGVSLQTFFCAGDTSFFSTASTPSRISSVRWYLHEFAVQQYRLAVKDEMSDETKKADDLQKDLDNFFKENERRHKKINENSRGIDRLKSDIRSNEKEQEMKQDEILKQKQLLSLFEGPQDMRETQEKKLKDLEKQKKKLLKQNESMHKDIEDYESDNRELERSIDKTTKDLIPKKNEEIRIQAEVVNKVNSKYNGIH